MNKTSNQGFSLIELMIVVAIIGILAMVAYPSYTQYVVRANRTDAMDKLSEIMFEQEKYQIRKRTYTDKLTRVGYGADEDIDSDEGHYQVSAAVCSSGIALADCVKLTATPKTGGIQANNGEQALTLNSRGEKTGKWKNSDT